MSSKARRRRRRNNDKSPTEQRGLGSNRATNYKSDVISASDLTNQQIAQSIRSKDKQKAAAKRKDWRCPQCTNVNAKNIKMCSMCGYDFEQPGVLVSHPLEDAPYGYTKVEKKKKRKPSSSQSSRPGSVSGSGAGESRSSDKGTPSTSAITSPVVFPQKSNGMLNRTNKNRTTSAASPHTAPSQYQLNANSFPDLAGRPNSSSSRLDVLSNPIPPQPTVYPGNSNLNVSLQLPPPMIPQKREERLGPYYCDNYKVKPCSYGIENRCPNGVRCEDYHNESEMRRAPCIIQYTHDPCEYLFDSTTNTWRPRTLCPLKSDCPYSHCQLEQIYHFMNYKTVPCNYFVDGDDKSCGWGDLCASAHGRKELRHPTLEQFNNYFRQQKRVNTHQNSQNGGFDLTVELSKLNLFEDEKEKEAQRASELKSKLCALNYQKVECKQEVERKRLKIQDQRKSIQQKQVSPSKQKELATLLTKNAEETKKASAMQDKMEQYRSQVCCQICMDRETDTALRCGHVFCWDCLKSVSQNARNCFRCRKPYMKSELTKLAKNN